MFPFRVETSHCPTRAVQSRIRWASFGRLLQPEGNFREHTTRMRLILSDELSRKSQEVGKDIASPHESRIKVHIKISASGIGVFRGCHDTFHQVFLDERMYE